MKSFAVLSATLALVHVAFAGGVPDGITDSCTTFLKSFDTNADIKSAFGSLNDAMSAFSADKYSSATADAVKSALTSSCGKPFPESAIKAQLTDFATECSAELTGDSPDEDVQNIYDHLYFIVPFHRAICTKGDNGEFCAANLPSGSSSQIPMGSTSDMDTAVGNMFTGTNLAYLFIDPKASKDTLCTPCTRNILNSYTSYESSTLYARGLKQSNILGEQQDMWAGVKETCGASFFTVNPGGSNVGAGGSLGMSKSSGAASLRVSTAALGGFALVAGALVL